MSCPGLNPEEGDLAAAFFASIDRQRACEQINAFIRAVRDSAELEQGLMREGYRLDAVSDFARAHGFRFSASELDAFFEHHIRSRTPEWALHERDRYLARQRTGEIPPPLAMDRSCPAVLQHVEEAPGFALARADILQGNVIVAHRFGAVKRMVERIRFHLEEAFRPYDPTLVHRSLCMDEISDGVEQAYAALKRDGIIPPVMVTLAASLGMDPDDVIFEWPGFRLMLPRRMGGAGFYRDGRTGSVGPHRDTWYGSPQHQINFWGPVYPLSGCAGLLVYPGHFYRSVKNSTPGYDVWRNCVGLQLSPQMTQEIREHPLTAGLNVGDVMLFAAHHLHASGANDGDRMRISFEFRMLNREDEGRACVPPNIDYHGTGYIYKGWFGPDGSEVHG